MHAQISLWTDDAVCCEGALPLVAAFLDLDQGWQAGRVALDILSMLCHSARDADGQHLDLLARLHPVRRLSNVLSTIQPFKEHMMAAGIVLKTSVQHLRDGVKAFLPLPTDIM